MALCCRQALREASADNVAPRDWIARAAIDNPSRYGVKLPDEPAELIIGSGGPALVVGDLLQQQQTASVLGLAPVAREVNAGHGHPG